jgi:eukaryotic-like serine/threonine-protein kinase
LAPQGSTANIEADGSSEALGHYELMTVSREHYDFRHEIARGGLGRITQALDRRLNRTVAIKELLRPSPASEARFLREIEVTVRLQHPNIVSIHEAGRWPDGQPFYAMNYVAGETLNQSIQRCRSVNDRLDLLSVVLNVTDAVAFAHSQWIVHRDLKPANILVGPFGETVVIDWGLARYAVEPPAHASGLSTGQSEVTLFGTAIGTPPYMPPEQVTGGETSERSDVYALGAILYHMLSGHPPFFEISAPNLLDVITKQAPTPLGTLVPVLPPDLIAIVAKAMSFDPRDRYPSAKDLGEELRKFTSGRLVAAYRYGLGDLLLRLFRRNTAAFATAGVFLIALAVLAGLSIEGIRRERDVARYNEAVARTESDRARGRAEALLVSQAQALTVSDPTLALAWLKQLDRIPPGAVTVAAQAEEFGVARFILRGHTDAITCVDTSPDSQSAVSGSDDKTLRLWTLGGEVSVLSKHTDRIASCRFSPDGSAIASGGYDGRVVIWNTATHEPQELAPNTSSVKSISFSLNGQSLYVATQSGLLRWYQLATGTWADYSAPNERWPILQPTTNGLLSGPHDGRFRLWQSDGSFVETPESAGPLRTAYWDADSDSVVLGSASGAVWRWAPRAPGLATLGQGTSEIAALSQLPHSSSVVAATDSGQVLLLDATGQKPLVTHTERVIDLRLSRSGRFVASGGWDKQVLLYDAASRSIRALLGHSDLVSGLSFTANEQFLVSSSWDNTLRVWALNDATQRARRVFFDHQVGVHSVRFSPNGKTLLTGGHDNVVRIRDLERDETRALKKHTDHIYRAIFSADGTRIASSGDDHAVHVWRSDGTHERALLGHTADVEELAFSSDGRWFASASEDHTARLWGVATWQARVLSHNGSVTQLEFSPDGRQLATASLDGRIRLFETETARQNEILNPEVGELTDLAFAKDGSLAAAAPAANLVVWRSPGEGTLRFFRNLVGAKSLVFSPDVQLLAISGAGSHLWVCILKTQVCREYPSTGGAIRSLAFAPDSRSLVTGGSDSDVYIWDVASAERRVYRGHRSTIFDLDISPDGHWIATAGGDGSVRLWPLLPVNPATTLRQSLNAATVERVMPPLPSPRITDGAPELTR